MCLVLSCVVLWFVVVCCGLLSYVVFVCIVCIVLCIALRCGVLHVICMQCVTCIGGVLRMGMLSTANYEARKYGVRAAMPGFIGKVGTSHHIIEDHTPR